MPTTVSKLRRLRPFASLFLLTVALSALGILTRAIESLALFWPVNAVLLGLLLRRPRLASPTGWMALYLGMVLADLASGSSWQNSLWLNLCNVGLICTGWLILRDLPVAHRSLKRPQGLLRIFLACFAGAAVAATLASLMKSTWGVWLIWFGEQLATNLLLLPVMLTIPSRWTHLLRLGRGAAVNNNIGPLLTLLLSLIAMLIVGGPGAIAFPLLPLLWCAMSMRPFAIAMLCLLSGAIEIIMIASNLAHFGVLQDSTSIDILTSARLGIAVLVLAPLSIAAANNASRRLLRRLARRANHDSLTGTLTRSAFSQQAERLMERRSRQFDLQPIAVLMLDLDHFKSINDRHGHPTGDHVLRLVASLLRQQLRQEDLLCRLGGEEFVALLPGIASDEAMSIADRLRSQVEKLALISNGGETLHVTISIGVDQLQDTPTDLALEKALARADAALYQAKALGRNRVVLRG